MMTRNDVAHFVHDESALRWVKVPELGSYFTAVGFGELFQSPMNADGSRGDEVIMVELDAITDEDLTVIRRAMGFDDEPNADEVR